MMVMMRHDFESGCPAAGMSRHCQRQRQLRLRFHPVVATSSSQWWFQQHPRAHMIQGKLLQRFLKKDRARFSKMFGNVLLFSVIDCFLLTAPRQAKNILLETLSGCAWGACTWNLTSVAMTAVAEFCHCVVVQNALKLVHL